jgi:hypothetical protein
MERTGEDVPFVDARVADPLGARYVIGAKVGSDTLRRPLDQRRRRSPMPSGVRTESRRQDFRDSWLATLGQLRRLVSVGPKVRRR